MAIPKNKIKSRKIPRVVNPKKFPGQPMKQFQKVIGGMQKVDSQPTMGDFESILDESASDINVVSRREDNAKTPPPAFTPNNEELKIKTQKSLNKMSMMATSTKPLQEREDKPAIVV